MIEIKLKKGIEPKVVIETLSRIGIANKREKVLYPSCYLYLDSGKSYIGHFKEIYALKEGGFNNISEDDIKRLNSVTLCLKKWDLIDIVDKKKLEETENFIFILPFKDKNQWKISHKIRISYE